MRNSFSVRRNTQVTIPEINIFPETITDAYNPTNYALGLSGMKKYSIPGCMDAAGHYANPPSHGTLVVSLLKGGVLIEKIFFGNNPTQTEDPVYTRSRDGIAPFKIVTYNYLTGTLPVSFPATRTLNGNDGELVITNAGQTSTRLIYDYATNNSGWKFVLNENPLEISETTGRYDSVVFSFDIGRYNVINSIVPKIGYNLNLFSTNYADMVANIPNRFQGNDDFYSVMTNPEYRDSADDYIDDFSVTFGVNMTGEYGNGDTEVTANEFIRYKEAFLFNGLDEMFSMITLPVQFDKNSGTAYYISWTILAPVN